MVWPDPLLLFGRFDKNTICNSILHICTYVRTCLRDSAGSSPVLQPYLEPMPLQRLMKQHGTKLALEIRVHSTRIRSQPQHKTANAAENQWTWPWFAASPLCISPGRSCIARGRCRYKNIQPGNRRAPRCRSLPLRAPGAPFHASPSSPHLLPRTGRPVQFSDHFVFYPYPLIYTRLYHRYPASHRSRLLAAPRPPPATARTGSSSQQCHSPPTHTHTHCVVRKGCLRL